MTDANPPMRTAFSAKRMTLAWTALAAIAVLLIGLADYLSGPDLAFTLFYLIPISAVAWRTGNRRFGVAIALLSSAAWFAAELTMAASMLHPLLIAWNVITRLTVFVSMALLLSAFKASLEHERTLARTDFVTKVLNARAFSELTKAEIDRSRRYAHSLTVAYVDLDNFKSVNDHHGHSQGDEVLRMVAKVLDTHLRQSDMVARMGGDEFALMLPEAGPAAVEPVMNKLQEALAEAMQQHGWPVTFSIGVVTFDVPPATVDELIGAADKLMYLAKADGKARVRYSHVPGPSPA